MKQLRQQIDRLSAKIDNAEDAILDAPPELRPGLYRKLQELTEDRKRIQGVLDSASRQQTSEKDRRAEIDREMDALRDLGNALGKAKPEDTKELLSSIVTKIELFYDHTETLGGRKKSEFTHGIVYLRPDAGEGRSANPNSSITSKSRPSF